MSIDRAELEGKPFSAWTPAEQEAAKDMTHTLGVSYYNVRRLAQHGDKGQSWDTILSNALDQLEETK